MRGRRHVTADTLALLAGAWDEGQKVGLRQADWEYGVTPNPMPELANPYRTERTDHE